MDGVVDRIEIVLLGELRKLELAVGRAVLGVNAHLKILLGAVGDDLAEKLRELRRVLGLLKAGLLPVHADLGVALAVRNARHRKVHTDFGALAFKICSQPGDDLLAHIFGNVRAELLANADNMLRRPDLIGLLLDKLGAGDMAYRTFGRGNVAFVNITAYRANPFLHSNFPPK